MLFQQLMLLVLEQSGTDSTVPTLTPFFNLGAIGVLAAGLLLFAKGAYQREVKRADEAEDALRELHAKVIDSYVPSLTRATDALLQLSQRLDSPGGGDAPSSRSGRR